LELTVENNQQTEVKPLIAKVMKTVRFDLFQKDRIQEKELNFLKGGTTTHDPVSDVLNPPRR